MITKLISGGQTGADRGGLDSAIHCDLPHGGWCPKGRRAEDGVSPAEYHVTEMLTDKYLPRTQANVIDSDAMVIFTYGPLGGSLKTPMYTHQNLWLTLIRFEFAIDGRPQMALST